MKALIADESPDGINVRAKGGVLVAPGSLHAQTGRTYRLASDSLAVKPEAMRDLVEKPAARTREPGIPVSPFARRRLAASARATLIQEVVQDRSANLLCIAIAAFVAGFTFRNFRDMVLASSGAALAHVEDQPDPERALERAWRAASEEMSGRSSTTERVTEYAIRRAEREGLAPGPRRMLEAICRWLRLRGHYRDFPLSKRTAGELGGIHHDTAATHLSDLVNDGYLLATREGLRLTEATLYSLPDLRVPFETPITEIPRVGLDVWRRGELGDTGRRVHRRLTDQAMTLSQIMAASDIGKDTAYRLLTAMAAHGLARKTATGWVRGDADPADYVASGRHHSGAIAEEQRERHRRDREDYREALAAKHAQHEERRASVRSLAHVCRDGSRRAPLTPTPTCCSTVMRARTRRGAPRALVRPCGTGTLPGTPPAVVGSESAAPGRRPRVPPGIPSRASPDEVAAKAATRLGGIEVLAEAVMRGVVL